MPSCHDRNAARCCAKPFAALAIALAIAPTATMSASRWRLPATIEAKQDVSARAGETGQQARGALYVGRGSSFTIKKGQRFLMVKIGSEGGCRIEYEKRRYEVTSCPWLDGFRDHQEDFFTVVAGRLPVPLLQDIR